MSEQEPPSGGPGRGDASTRDEALQIGYECRRAGALDDVIGGSAKRRAAPANCHAQFAGAQELVIVFGIPDTDTVPRRQPQDGEDLPQAGRLADGLGQYHQTAAVEMDGEGELTRPNGVHDAVRVLGGRFDETLARYMRHSATREFFQERFGRPRGELSRVAASGQMQHRAVFRDDSVDEMQIASHPLQVGQPPPGDQNDGNPSCPRVGNRAADARIHRVVHSGRAVVVEGEDAKLHGDTSRSSRTVSYGAQNQPMTDAPVEDFASTRVSSQPIEAKRAKRRSSAPGVPGSRLARESDMHQRFFLDRREAGRMLALALLPFKAQDPVVLALPRGGVPVAFEIARFLDAPLAAFIVRKIGVPGHRELAMGALASGGIQVLDGDLIRRLRVPPHAVDTVIAEEMRELTRREERYGAGHAPPLLRGRTVILVDDGLATGLTMRAAVQAARKQQPARIVVAAPVGSSEAVRMLQAEADEVLCLRTPEPFAAVGLWYARFEQTTDDEVRELLGQARDVARLAG